MSVCISRHRNTARLLKMYIKLLGNTRNPEVIPFKCIIIPGIDLFWQRTFLLLRCSNYLYLSDYEVSYICISIELNVSKFTEKKIHTAVYYNENMVNFVIDLTRNYTEKKLTVSVGKDIQSV